MKYISKYSNNKEVTAAQYITELICENKARIDKKDIHYRFWTNKTWAKFYRDQIATANKLLETYSPRAIINAIKNPSSSRTYSLRSKYLVDTIKQEEAKLDKQSLEINQNFDRSSNKTFKKTDIQNNIISKLRELE
jgi:hypothetical protein